LTRTTVKTPENLLKGCHNCKKHGDTDFICWLTDVEKCEWETDETYEVYASSEK